MKNMNIFKFNRLMSGMATGSELSCFVDNGKKILGAALNYMDIVRARNVPVPTEPLLFLKPTSSYIQEGEKIVLPKGFTKVAHEVELGCVIGKKCKNVSEKEAMNYVGGYCLALDLTAQCALGEARAKGHPWSLGKGFDTATPVSKFLPACAVKDPHNLNLWLKVNGEIRQKGNTKDLIFNIPQLVAYASKFMTLEPNDVILTGTPDGAGPLKSGDVVLCGMGDLVDIKFTVCAE